MHKATSRVTKIHPAKKTAKSAGDKDIAKDACTQGEEHSLPGFS
jgi:hypothetical protein